MGLLYSILCVEVVPSDTLAASVDTCCGRDILGPLRGAAYAGAFEEEQVDFAESADQGEESLSVSSQGQPLSPGLPPSPGLARRSGVQTEALPRGGNAPACNSGGAGPPQERRPAVLGGPAWPRRERGQDQRAREETWRGASGSVGWDSIPDVWRGHNKRYPWREALPQDLARSGPGEARRRWQDERWRASGGFAWGPATDVWRGRNEARWEDASREREQAASSRPSRLLSEGNPEEVRLRSKYPDGPKLGNRERASGYTLIANNVYADGLRLEIDRGRKGIR